MPKSGAMTDFFFRELDADWAVFELVLGQGWFFIFFRARVMPTMALRAVGALLQLRERITVHPVQIW